MELALDGTCLAQSLVGSNEVLVPAVGVDDPYFSGEVVEGEGGGFALCSRCEELDVVAWREVFGCGCGGVGRGGVWLGRGLFSCQQ